MNENGAPYIQGMVSRTNAYQLPGAVGNQHALHPSIYLPTTQDSNLSDTPNAISQPPAWTNAGASIATDMNGYPALNGWTSVNSPFPPPAIGSMANDSIDHSRLPQFQPLQTQTPYGASMAEYQPYGTNPIGFAGLSSDTHHQAPSREVDGDSDDPYPSTSLNLDGDMQQSVPDPVARRLGPLSSVGQQVPDDDIDLDSEEIDDEDLLALLVDERYASQ